MVCAGPALAARCRSRSRPPSVELAHFSTRGRRLRPAVPTPRQPSELRLDSPDYSSWLRQAVLWSIHPTSGAFDCQPLSRRIQPTPDVHLRSAWRGSRGRDRSDHLIGCFFTSLSSRDPKMEVGQEAVIHSPLSSAPHVASGTHAVIEECDKDNDYRLNIRRADGSPIWLFHNCDLPRITLVRKTTE